MILLLMPNCQPTNMLSFCSELFQKEKVKVYIDEKYHHATEPSIRPKPKLEGGPQPGIGGGGGVPGQPVGAAANPADVPDHPSSSRTTTLSANARQMNSASKAVSTNNLVSYMTKYFNESC